MMRHLEKVYIPPNILEETSKSLRSFGARKCEGLVLWLGIINKDSTSNVKKVLTPPQASITCENGVGYFIKSETLFSINKLLSSTGLRLLVQVHSHPGRAYHSAADDRYCIVTTEGGFSIVVPNFGFGCVDLSMWATYRLMNQKWEKLSSIEVDNIFRIEGRTNFYETGKKKISILI